MSSEQGTTNDKLLTPGEVAARCQVEAKTVRRWANAGKLGVSRTDGGHRRYSQAEILKFLPTEEKLYRPEDVARMFRVDPKTVIRWAEAGKLTVIRLPGGHRRYLVREVDELIEASRTSRDDQ